MSDPLLKIANHHTAACGDPPIVDGSAENCYVGYFENSYGEQWIFTLDRGTGKATLRGGDVGWNTVFDVTNGTVADLILGQKEQLASGLLVISPAASRPLLRLQQREIAHRRPL